VIAANASAWVWYVARASGLVSLVLLSASVVLGIVTSTRWLSERWPRFTTTMLHRNVSLLAVTFLALHVTTIVLDGFAPIGWLDVVVPFASPYRTLWLGLGTVAFDLVLALVLTSLLRNRIGPRPWRAIHWLAYVCWPVAVVHGLGTGTDTATRVVLVVDAVCVGAVVAAVWWRVRLARTSAGGWIVAATVVSVLLGLVWLANGPLARGWASRAGTPAALLGGGAGVNSADAAPVTATAPPTPAPAPAVGRGFSSSFSGTATSSEGPNGTVTVTLEAPTSAGELTVVLTATQEGSGLAVRSGTVRIGDGSAAWSGTLDEIEGNTILASPATGSGVGLAITIDQLDQGRNRWSGSVRAVGSGGADGHR
jgi:DMSO/TMAO reductase YedYZ heme-binding membrane subunit